MKNWLYIFQGKVVHIVEQEHTATDEDWPDSGWYDTVAQDDSKTFQVGDTFTADLQLYYNRNIWKDMGWIDEKMIAILESNPPNPQTGLIENQE